MVQDWCRAQKPPSRTQALFVPVPHYLQSEDLLPIPWLTHLQHDNLQEARGKAGTLPKAAGSSDATWESLVYNPPTFQQGHATSPLQTNSHLEHRNWMRLTESNCVSKGKGQSLTCTTQPSSYLETPKRQSRYVYTKHSGTKEMLAQSKMWSSWDNRAYRFVRRILL